jgi:hypothetical protein
VYYGDGEGLTHRASWAWVSEVHEGRITRIVEIQHLGAVAEAVRDVVSKAQSGATAQHGSASTA